MLCKSPQDLDSMRALCAEWGPRLALRVGEPDGTALLYTLFLNERYNAANAVPRFEPAYAPGGRYYDPTAWAKWGEACAKSYSNFQIMFPVAAELGYAGAPDALDDDATAIQYVVRLVNRRLIVSSRKDDQVATLVELLDAYNSGNPRDENIPHQYIARGQRNYAQALPLFTA